MEFEQFYLGCLAQASYLVGADGECAIVDPRRDVELYLEAARERGLAIRHVILTHLHADFVAGHCELARRAGATIWISEHAHAEFEHRAATDGEELRVGGLRLVFLATPGHTPESMTVLVYDPALSEEQPQKMLTGDTLFIGDVGRPDLVGSQGLTPEAMAGMLYDSLRDKLMPLGDAVEVYPGHGAGSACGKNMSSERWSTLGKQRVENWALQSMSREDFVRESACGLNTPPRYFQHDATTNRRGAAGLDEQAALAELAPHELVEARDGGALVLDVRSNVEYGEGHVPGSVNVGLSGQFASWCGSLIDAERALVLVGAGAEQVAEARTRLARVGMENVVGALAGGVAAWESEGRELGFTEQIEVHELARRLEADSGLVLLDVRKPGEWEGGHAPRAVTLTLTELEARVAELDASCRTAVICGSGYRSSAATGILARAGFEQLSNVLGGTNAWVAAELPLQEFAAEGA